MDTPLLLIHFNRPDISARQIEVLRPIAPRKVYVLCDAARPGRPGEAARVAEVRRLLQNLPWAADVKFLFRDENLGCFRNLSSGISWFMEEVGEGIILEDDCLPDPSFFPYCTELLERYRTDPRVFAVCGHNHSPKPLPIPESYAFSNYFACWGWATWQRAWSKFDPDLTGWRDRAQWREICLRVLPSWRARLYWRWMFGQVATGKRDSWAYRYLLTIWQNKGVSTIPRTNLVENAGLTSEGTHTKNSWHLHRRTIPLSFPMLDPGTVTTNRNYDRGIEDLVHSKSFAERVKWALRKIAR